MNDPAIAAHKSDLRATVLAGRKRFAATGGPEASRAIAAHAAGLPQLVAPDAVVGGYWPIRGEVDPRPLLASISRHGLATALPLIVGDDLAFHTWREGDSLVPAGLGTFGPDAAAPIVAPSVLLVPLVAFDRRGHRLGYGRGFYDRVIARLKARGPVFTIGLAYAMQEVREVPVEPHDQPLDSIVTDGGVVMGMGKAADAVLVPGGGSLDAAGD